MAHKYSKKSLDKIARASINVNDAMMTLCDLPNGDFDAVHAAVKKVIKSGEVPEYNGYVIMTLDVYYNVLRSIVNGS